MFLVLVMNKCAILLILLIQTVLENTVRIQASSNLPLAGENFTLTCNVVCDRPPQGKWLDPTGQTPTAQGISLSPQTFNGQTYSLQMHFDHIRTSHTGIYTCISNTDVPPSSQLATRLVRVQRKFNLCISNCNLMCTHVPYLLLSS